MTTSGTARMWPACSAALASCRTTSIRAWRRPCKFVALKVLDGQGQGTTSMVIKAIEYVIAHNRTLGVKVINLSLGHPIYAPAKYDPLVQAVERAVQAGIVVVVAAGNNGLDQNGDGESGYTGINSPANAPSSHRGRRGRYEEHDHARRRRGRGVQLARADVV